MIEFKGWPKISRLFRDIVITEKIDGTNAAIGIQEFQFGWHVGGTDDDGINHDMPENATLVMGPCHGDDGLPVFEYVVYAQSRNRIITPGKNDHYEFAGWVYDNAESLVDILGVGLHFGEWWGSGINRGYGLPKGERRFSLFNTSRWDDQTLSDTTHKNVPELTVVPILYQGEFSTLAVQGSLDVLRMGGSVAVPQFMHPEGCVVFHTAANVMFKATLENDEMPKALAAVAAVEKPREIKKLDLIEISLDYEPSPYGGELMVLAA